MEKRNLHNPLSRTVALGSSQSLTQMSARNLPVGKCAAGAYDTAYLPAIDFSEPCWPVLPVTEIAVITFLCKICTSEVSSLVIDSEFALTDNTSLCLAARGLRLTI